MSRMRSSSPPPAALLRNRAFLLLWAAYGISAMGDHISEMAVLKWMGAMESPNMTRLQALMNFMFMLPFFLAGPVNGMLADRLPRRGIMIAADLIRAGLMLNFAWLLTVFGRLGDIGAFVPLMLVGIFAALFSPARSALLPALIRQDQLVRANAMTSGLGVIATMVAVVIGGKLADHFPPQVSFMVDAGTFLASAACLLMIGRGPRPVAAAGGPGALVEAVTYVRQHRRVIQLMLVAVVVWSCGAAVRSMMPALVHHAYERDRYTDIGIFQGFLGLGLLTGALVLTLLGDALRGDIAITWSLAGVSAAVGVIALTALDRLSGSPWLSAGAAHHLGAVAVVVAGMFSAGVMTSYNALMQRIVPDRLRGRVFGLTDLVSIGGLLLATGLLGLVPWPGIDAWLGWIMLAVAGVVLAAAVASMVLRLRRGPIRGRRRFWWNLNEFYCRFWFRLRRRGPCTVPAEGPVVVVCNHTSPIDPLLLIACTPSRVIGFMIAREYADLPVFRRLTGMIGCIPVRRDGQDAVAVRTALRRLAAGGAVGVFLEGGIPRPGQEVRPKEGAALLALRTAATIVPAHISGVRYDGRVVRTFFRRHRAEVRFGRPIRPDRRPASRPGRREVAELTDLLMERIRELGRE